MKFKVTKAKLRALEKALKAGAVEVERERQKREAAQREMYRCQCHRGPHAFCYWHTRIGAAT